MLDAIASTLKETARSDVFCARITASYDQLSLSVDSLGPVEFPISARMAKALILEAEPARFGKRDKTMLDRRVRDAWEVPKDHVQLNGPWGELLENVLRQVNGRTPQPADLHARPIFQGTSGYRKSRWDAGNPRRAAPLEIQRRNPGH